MDDTTSTTEEVTVQRETYEVRKTDGMTSATCATNMTKKKMNKWNYISHLTVKFDMEKI